MTSVANSLHARLACSDRRPFSRRRTDEAGVTLIEVLVAAFLLLVVLTSIAQVVLRGRVQIDYEENRRRATAIAQARLDHLRRDYHYDALPHLSDTTYTVDGRSFSVSHDVEPGTPETLATSVRVIVRWTERVDGQAITRGDTTVTILARGLP